ncbi:MAG: hypothetical protein IIX54_05215 [Clostridia bacterium]|nr:hypothetical protein [Clostridia bacterium]
MKIVRAISILISIIIIVTGVCGCMNTNEYSNVDNDIKTELMEYAVEQYGGTYQEVFYETAADATQNYVLCLKDEKGRIFNVFEDGESGRRTDDYKDCIVDSKMKAYLSNYLGLEEAAIGVMAIMNIDIDVAELETMSAEECINKFGLYSLIFAYKFEGNKGSIANKGQEVVDIYTKLSGINTSTIDFNVVATSENAPSVDEVFENMRHRYSGSWYSCEGVQEYISTANPQLTTLDDLKSLVKE